MIPSTAAISERPGAILRALGARWIERDMIKFKWGEVSRGWGLALELVNFGLDGGYWSLHVQPIYGQFYIRLPFMPRREPHPDEMLEGWGASWRWGPTWHDAIHLCWGRRTKIVHMPWSLVNVAHLVVRPDGTWVPWVGSWETEKQPDGRAVEVHPYRYVTSQGEVQNVQATIYVEEWRHVWRSFKWLGWPRRVSRSIDVRFDNPIGEDVNSYKGGTYGCGYSMRRGESARECLYRMQRERRFR